MSDIISKGIGTGLDAFVVGTEGLGVVAHRTRRDAGVVEVVLETSGAVVSAHGVGCDVLEFEIVRIGASSHTEVVERIGDEAIRTYCHAFSHVVIGRVVVETKLSTVGRTFHDGLHRVVTGTRAVLTTRPIVIGTFKGVTVYLWG